MTALALPASAPIPAGGVGPAYVTDETRRENIDRVNAFSPAPPVPPAGAAASGEPFRPRRQPLPNRRPLVSIGFEHDGHKYHLGVGAYPDGRVGEVWLATAKASSALEAMARDVAIVISVALQSGLTVTGFCASVQRQPDGEPASLLGTVLDLIVAEGFA